MKTYKLTAKIDFVDNERHKLIVASLKEAAQVILATAMLITDKRQPSVSLSVMDPINGNVEIDLTSGE